MVIIVILEAQRHDRARRIVWYPQHKLLKGLERYFVISVEGTVGEERRDTEVVWLCTAAPAQIDRGALREDGGRE